MKWILLPGLGGDHRLFDNMVDLLPDYQVLRLEVPCADESIEDYAQRLAEQIETNQPIVLCGISFGGMLASILCAHLKPVFLVLMSSTHRPEALTDGVRVFEWMSRCLPNTFAGWLRGIGHLPARWLEPLRGEPAETFKALLKDAPIELIRRGGRMTTEWHQAPAISCPRYHLQGSRDLLMPSAKVDPTHIADGAGHLMNLTHPQEVRSFIRQMQEPV